MPPPSLAHVIPQSSSQSSTSLSSRRLLTPTTNPIPLLASPAARYTSYAHTLLIPLYYYLRSPALIHDPLDTLIWDLLPISIIQALSCATYLPSAGTWNSGTKDSGRIIEGTAAVAAGKSGGSGKGSMRRKGKAPATGGGEGGGSLGSRIMPTIFSLILTFALPTLPLTVLALCLGAPLFPYNQIPHTVLLATHVSLLGFLPIFYTHGVSGSAWRDVAAAWLPFDEAGAWAGTVGCMVGGWIGAIPIALDWDREWQKWPCTVVWGVVMGWVVGRVVTGLCKLGVGRRIDMSENEEIPRDLLEELEAEKKKS